MGTWAAGAAFIVLAWGLYLANVAFGFHLGSSPSTPESADSERTAYLIVAAVVTLAAVPITLLAVRHFKNLAALGVEGVARVVKVSGLSKAGRTLVGFVYEAAGVAYQKRIDVNSDWARRYEPSTRLPVVYLPAKPGLCIIETNPDHAVGAATSEGRREVRGGPSASYPQVPPSRGGTVLRAMAEGAAKGAVEGMYKPLIVMLLVANVVVVGGVCYLAGGPGTVGDYALALFFLGAAMMLGEEIALTRYRFARRPAGFKPGHTLQIVGIVCCLVGVAVVTFFVHARNVETEQAVRQQMNVR